MQNLTCIDFIIWEHYLLTRVHIRLDVKVTDSCFLYVNEPLIEMITIQSLWHIIIWNRCISQGLNQCPVVSNVHSVGKYSRTVLRWVDLDASETHCNSCIASYWGKIHPSPIQLKGQSSFGAQIIFCTKQILTLNFVILIELHNIISSEVCFSKSN